jgi:4-hydroxy-3-methylbut-2-enyl diphosphate reductase
VWCECRYHVNVPGCISEKNTIEHRTVNGDIETVADFLPLDRPVRIGVTSGASTPDSVVQECLERIVLIKKMQSAA